MLKKRIIFTLLYKDGSFCLSRNFNLQKVGNLNWIKKNYDFSLIAKSIDELIILNVSDENNSVSKFCKTIELLSRECFLPLSIKNWQSKYSSKYMQVGDKLVIILIYLTKIYWKEFLKYLGNNV